MNTIQILSALNNPTFYNSKKYAAKLVTLWNLAKELKQMEGFNVLLSDVQGNLQIVKGMPILSLINYKIKHKYGEDMASQRLCRDIYGEFQQWQVITLTHNLGYYSFALPYNTKFYFLFLEFVGIETKKDAIKNNPIQSILLPFEILQSVSKAIKFISKDELRPALNGVSLKIKDNKLQVAATDCHKLFYSPFFDCIGDDGTYIIPINAAKEIIKLKTKKDALLLINIYKGNKAELENIDFMLIDARFPDYSVVIPKYKNFMEFNREQMITNVKKVLPYSNKCTSQVNLHLNGSIALHTQDVDFSFECDADMPYITKDFKDTDIAFNGTLLNTCLNSFKDTNVKMFTDGENSKGAIFSNGIDNVLLMPLMINNY